MSILQQYTQQANWRHLQYKGGFGNITASANRLASFLRRWDRPDQLKELDEARAMLLAAEQKLLTAEQIARGLAIETWKGE